MPFEDDALGWLFTEVVPTTVAESSIGIVSFWSVVAARLFTFILNSFPTGRLLAKYPKGKVQSTKVTSPMT